MQLIFDVVFVRDIIINNRKNINMAMKIKQQTDILYNGTLDHEYSALGVIQNINFCSSGLSINKITIGSVKTDRLSGMIKLMIIEHKSVTIDSHRNTKK